jgi:hypothetical protein
MLSITSVWLITLASQAFSKEMAPDLANESLYRSGAIMQKMMANKEVHSEHHTWYTYLRILICYRLHLLDSERLALIIQLNTRKSTTMSHVWMGWPQPSLETQTTRFAVRM